MNAIPAPSSAAISMRRDPSRSTRNPTGSWADTATTFATVSARPSSTNPTPSWPFRNGNSGGNTRFWKWLTKCAAETSAIA